MKILMVCLGNICRSPLAEGVLKHKAKISGMEIEVDSAGTGAWHSGEQPDRRSMEKASEYGIDISNQRARQFKKDDFANFDRIYAMDRSNYSDIAALASSENELKKVKLILNELYPNENMDVPDPYYGGEDGFEHVYQLLDRACDSIVKTL